MKQRLIYVLYILFILFIMARPTWAALFNEREPSTPPTYSPFPRHHNRADETPFNPVDMACGNLQYFARTTTENIESHVLPLIRYLRGQHVADDIIVAYLDLAQRYVQKTYFDFQSQQSYRPTLTEAIGLIWRLDQTIQNYNPSEAIPTMKRVFHLIVDELFAINPSFHKQSFVAFHTGFEATNYREDVATLILRTAVRMLGYLPDVDLFMNIHRNLVVLAIPGMDNLPSLENHFQIINGMLLGFQPWQLPPILKALDEHSLFISLQQQLSQQTPSPIMGQFSPLQSDAG